MLAHGVGSFEDFSSALGSSSSFLSSIVPHTERGGATALCTKPVRDEDFPLCVSPGPLALLQENSAVFQGRLRPRLERMKEFGRQTEEHMNCCWMVGGGSFEPTVVCHSAGMLIRPVCMRAHTYTQT